MFCVVSLAFYLREFIFFQPLTGDGFDLLHLRFHKSEAANGSWMLAAGSIAQLLYHTGQTHQNTE